MSDDRNEAGNPKGAGKSAGDRAENIAKSGKEAGSKDMQSTGKTNRPVGTSTARDTTGVDPQDPIDPEMPNLKG